MRGTNSPLDRYRDTELTLDTLVHAADRLLRDLALRPDDGRVAQTMDARGVRYYQTLGVMDRPLRYAGRRAVYGFRHLLQLLAIRKLQQAGHPLQLIQRALAGRSTETLEQALAAPVPPRSNAPGEGGPVVPVRLQRDAPRDREEPDGADACNPRPSALVAAQVAPGITLVVDPAVVADPDAVVGEVEEFLSSRRKRR